MAASVDGPRIGGPGDVSTAGLHGKVVVINFWASWCKPCRKEAPDLERASRTLGRTAQFIGVNNSDVGEPQAAAFLRNFKIGYPNLRDESGAQLLKFAGQLPPDALPSTLVIDKNGKVAARIVGPADATTLVELVKDTSAGR